MRTAFWSAFKAPDRSPLWAWAQQNNIRLPHSARSQDFDITITPWLRDPATAITDGLTNELSIVGAVQGAKSTLAELALAYWFVNEPGPVMFNAQTNEDAWDASEDRIIPMLWASDPTRPLVESLPVNDLSKKKISGPGWFALFQGAHSRSNLQSKSIRYLVNDEPWMYPIGNLTEAYKRVTAFWNSFVLNTSTGGLRGGEFDEKLSDATHYQFNIACPLCKKTMAPLWMPPKDPRKPGGMRYDRSLIRSDGYWDAEELRASVHYSCWHCGGHIYDTPPNRRFMSLNGKYEVTRDGIPEKKFYTFNGIVVDWVGFYPMVEEWLKAIRAIRYGDDVLLKEFIMKRLAEFWDADRHRPVTAVVEVTHKLKMNSPLRDADFRCMTVDVQHGYFYALVRDWKRDHGCRLIQWEKIDTEDDLDNMRDKFGVEPSFVLVDAAHFTVKVYRMCAKYGYTALRGSDKKSFTHTIDHGDWRERIQRIYSPVVDVDPWIGTKSQGSQTAALIHFSKFEARERLFALRKGEVEGMVWETPENVGDEYHKQLDSEEKRIRHHPRTNEPIEEYVQVRKANHLLDTEVFQVIMASIAGMVGAEAGEPTESVAPE